MLETDYDIKRCFVYVDWISHTALDSVTAIDYKL
jgi:hypothetical protein